MLERNRQSYSNPLNLSAVRQDREFVDLRDVVAFLRRFRMLIAVSILIGLAGAAFYLSTTSSRYVATAQLLIEPKITPLVSQLPSDVNLSLDTAQIESQIAVLESEKIATMVIDQLKLEENPTFLQSRGQKLSDKAKQLAERIQGLFTPSTASTKSQAGTPEDAKSEAGDSEAANQLSKFEKSRRTMAIFRNGLNIRRVGVSYALEISYTSLDPELSASVANATADAYMREQIDNKAKEVRAGTAWLEGRLAELKGLMNSATQAVQEFRIKHDYSIHQQSNTQSDDQNAVSENTIGANVAGDQPDAQNSQEPTLEELEVTADTYRKMYESFLQAYTNSVNQQTYSPPNARIITAAAAPLMPTYPRPKLVMAFGALAGLLAGIGIAFARQALDDSVRSQEQIRSEIGVECLGVLPPAPHDQGKTAAFDIPARYPTSIFSQYLSNIRTVIGYLDRDRPIRLLGVVSGSSDEDKSMLAGNLATLSAMNGVRTLLIEADSSQQTLFDSSLPREPEMMASNMNAEIVDNIFSVEGHSFDVLSVRSFMKTRNINPDVLKSALSELDLYNLIIVDLPPLTSRIDAVALYPMLDGLVISARWAKTPISQLAELTRLLVSMKANILGIVITNFRPR